LTARLLEDDGVIVSWTARRFWDRVGRGLAVVGVRRQGEDVV